MNAMNQTNVEQLLSAIAAALRAGVHPLDVAQRVESAIRGGADSHYDYNARALWSDIEDTTSN